MYAIVGLAITAMAGTNALGTLFLVLVLFIDTEFTASIEAVAAIYGSIGWVLTIEILLFTGFLATAIVDLITVNSCPVKVVQRLVAMGYRLRSHVTAHTCMSPNWKVFVDSCDTSTSARG